jgi:hypothetical protein
MIVLMIVVPVGRFADIQHLLERRQPEASNRAIEPPVPAFP